ncbi:energy transducer TonB [Flavivirga spongiicola]|uniref:Energy transducer TonB n=1 Tax=Flavivirga spongiicola TaxID=421621 RepID=A0ABU7XTQ5_9FLAO|nr:hypothetical protein [Flavivirga sp. MEBiC05379]MDO5978314.1 hypothetical protein [Flavivirga sp. MEBiC05379]
MKQLFPLILLFLNASIYSQEKTDEAIEESHKIPFAIIEKPPIYNEIHCHEKLSNSELKKCFTRSIANHVSRHFNANVVKRSELLVGQIRIRAFFTIDKEGNIKDIKAEVPHPKYEEETFRVLKLIPKMKKPGYHKGKPVSISYMIPIVFNMDNSESPGNN